MDDGDQIQIPAIAEVEGNEESVGEDGLIGGKVAIGQGSQFCSNLGRGSILDGAVAIVAESFRNGEIGDNKDVMASTEDSEGGGEAGVVRLFGSDLIERTKENGGHRKAEGEVDSQKMRRKRSSVLMKEEELHLNKEENGRMLNGNSRGTYQSIRAAVDELLRCTACITRTSDQFNSHTVILCCGRLEFTTENGEERFCCALSTENLLLNAYRQQSTGQDMALEVETSYRYMYGYGLIIVRVANFAQKDRTIGYGVCSHNDQNAHEFVFRALKEEVESVVDRFASVGVAI